MVLLGMIKPSYISRHIVIPVILISVLILMAGLQFIWLKDLSVGQRDRMQKNIEIGAERFAGDFSTTFHQLQAAFQFPDYSEDESIRSETVMRRAWQNWRNESNYPDLVKSLYVYYLPDENMASSLWQLKWPDISDSISENHQPYLASRITTLQRQPELAQNGIHNLFSDTPFLESGIADARIVRSMPMVRVSTIANKFDSVSVPSDSLLPLRMRYVGSQSRNEPNPLHLLSTIGYVFIEIDTTYLKQFMIPDLAQLHLQTDGSMDFNLAVARNIDRDSVDVFYGNLNNSKDLSEADLSIPLLKYRATSVFIINSGANVMIQSRFGTNVGENLELSTISKNSEVSSNWMSADRIESFTVSAAQKAAESTRAFSFQYETQDSLTRAGVTAIDDQWKLYIRHRLGSIDAASNSFRRNSMAMSLGILSILGVGIMLIVRNNRKSNDLARQQMEFVAGVSHELRTPLSVIRSASDNMTAGLITDQESAKRYGSLIHSESLRLNDLVEQVLEFSGIQSGQRRYEYATLNVLHLCLNSLKGLGERLDPSRVRLQVVVKACPYIMGDSTALVSVIQNLIINAIKYSPNDPIVRLIIEGGSTDTKKYAMLHVVDNGQGIAADEIKHIFEPFYRAKGVRDQQIKGNGLGLSIVQSIMKQHDGSISVASKPNEGSTFTLTFSWIEPKSKPKPVTANKS